MNLKLLLVVTFIGFFTNSWPAKLAPSLSNGAQLETIKISSGAFSPFDGGSMNSLNGCYVNRLDGTNDGDMYVALNLPVGSTIVSITAHFWDWTLNGHQRPILHLRTYQGGSVPVILASAQRETPQDGTFFYEQDATVDPSYTVQEGDFFDLIFDSGDDQIVNAYYICGVEIDYIEAGK